MRVFAKLRYGSIFFVSMMNFSIAQAQDLARAQIGFGSTINDSEITELLSQHSVAPTAVSMWASGLTGTHRIYEEMSIDKLMTQARAEVIVFFEAGAKSNTRRLKAFLDAHTEEELNESEALQSQARSLLNLRKQLKGALSTAKSGQPLVYAVELEGDAYDLEQVRVAPEVKASIAVDAARPHADAQSVRAERGRSVKPSAYNAEYLDPKVQTMSPRDLFSRVSEIVSSAE